MWIAPLGVVEPDGNLDDNRVSGAEEAAGLDVEVEGRALAGAAWMWKNILSAHQSQRVFGCYFCASLENSASMSG